MRAPSPTRRRAKDLRQEMTPPELILWARIRGRSSRLPAFRRQHPIGPYILDFYCAKAKLAIEVDGQSHGMGDRPQRDLAKDAYLGKLGLRVLRSQASEVMRDPNGVAASIVDAARLAPSVIEPSVR